MWRCAPRKCVVSRCQGDLTGHVDSSKFVGVRARVPKCIASPAASATVGASSGNEVVVRARGVYGRHVRLFERDGALPPRSLQRDRDGPGQRPRLLRRRDRRRATASRSGRRRSRRGRGVPDARATPIGRDARGRPRHRRLAAPVRAGPARDGSRVPGAAAGRLPALPRGDRSAEDLATELTDFLDRELPPSEWAVGEFSAARRLPPARVDVPREPGASSAHGPGASRRASAWRAPKR